jgi:AcrR family transcriptional regulator
MARDRYATRAAIMESAAELVAGHGVGGFGVNALADAAGCDKVLIYRYFGGLDGVLAALGEERMLWPRVAMVDGESDGSLADSVESLVLEEWAAFSNGALMLQSGAAEVVGANPLARATAAQRAERHAEMVAALRAKHRVPPYVDLAALVEILSAALTAFALRAANGDRTKEHAGDGAAQSIDPTTPQGWRRIEKTVGMMTRALLES